MPTPKLRTLPAIRFITLHPEDFAQRLAGRITELTEAIQFDGEERTTLRNCALNLAQAWIAQAIEGTGQDEEINTQRINADMARAWGDIAEEAAANLRLDRLKELVNALPRASLPDILEEVNYQLWRSYVLCVVFEINKMGGPDQVIRESIVIPERRRARMPVEAPESPKEPQEAPAGTHTTSDTASAPQPSFWRHTEALKKAHAEQRAAANTKKDK